jgi:SpoVK/Ycf46/Vps4 family AAA+-type ATPase
MDEVDSIGSARTENSGGGGDSEVQRTMLELLNQLDGFEASNKIKVGWDAVYLHAACVHAAVIQSVWWAEAR